MDIGWLESLIISLVSGFAEFLPISAQAHQSMLLVLFGEDGNTAALKLVIHIAALLALLLHTKEEIASLYRELKLASVPMRRRKRQPDQQSVLDVAHIRFSSYLLIAAFLFYPLTIPWQNDLSKVAVFLLANGILLYIPQHVPNGNKDSRSMTKLDGLFMGLAGGASVLPGVSRIGAVASANILRGADAKNALKWALLFSIPALSFLIGFDIYTVVTQGIAVSGIFAAVQCLLCGAVAFTGAYFAIIFARFLAINAGFSGFAYYSWGAALFSFILYLTT